MSDLLLSRTASMRARARLLMPRAPTVQKVMASPPTVTSGAAVTLARQWPTAHGDPYVASKISGAFRFTRCKPADILSNAIPSILNVTSNTGASPNTVNSVGMVFRHYGSDFEIEFSPMNSTTFLVKVDDEYVSLTPHQIVATTNIIWKFAFGSAANRRIEIILANAVPRGIWTADIDAITPAAVRGPRVLAFGDSFTSMTPNGWWLAFGDALGLDDVWASGVGGTGYKATASGLKFRARLAQDVIAYSPDIVVIHGLTNDALYATASDIYDEAVGCFNDLKAALPNALIMVAPNAQGGWSYANVGATMIANLKALKQAADAAGVFWLPMLELPLLGSVAPQTGLVTSTGGTVGAGTIRVNFVPPVGSTIEVGSGAVTERVVVKSITQITGSIWTLTIDGVLKYAHASGEAATHVGDNFYVGGGDAAATSGYGNCDVFLSATRHPTEVGAQAIGYQLAALAYNAVWGVS